MAEGREAQELEREPLIAVPSLSLATIGSMVTIIILTLLAEASGEVKDRLGDMTGHHWVSKGLIALGIFAATWLVSAVPLARQQDSPVMVRRWVLATAGVALAGIIIIFLFYVGHFVAE